MLDGVLVDMDNDTIQKMADHIVSTSCFKDVSLLIFKRYDHEVFLRMVILMDRFGNNYRMQAGNKGASDSHPDAAGIKKG